MRAIGRRQVVFRCGDYSLLIQAEQTGLGYDRLAMESERVARIEKNVGFALLIANSVRLALWWHCPASVAVPGDTLGLLGAILYFRGRHIIANKSESRPQGAPSA